MIKDDISNLQKAFNTYSLNNDIDLPYKILNYLIDRIKANREEIEKVISINKADITVDSIIDIINKEIGNEYESLGKTIIDKKGFLFAQVIVPVGIIAVETFEPEEIIKYWVKAIKTRNAIAVSSVEYEDYSVEALVFVIIQEALKKYNVDENLIMYMPFENCFYDYFDKVIYTYDKEGNTLEQPKVEKTKLSVDNIGKKYVYLENEKFVIEAQENKDCEILRGDIEEVIPKVKFSKGTVIYTEDAQKAFEFINLAQSDNVFVNANLSNITGVMKSGEDLYKYKNIIIPVPQEILKQNKEKGNIEDSKNEKEKIEQNETDIKEEKLMVEYKESLWSKIKKHFKNLLKI